MNLANKIVDQIKLLVQDAATLTEYRTPLVGFASVQNPLFSKLKNIVGPQHILPTEMLSNAQTVISFFIPFHESIVIANKKSSYVAREWCIAYIETNHLIQNICEVIIQQLSSDGINGAYQKATHNFNQEDLTAIWSHKSIAYIAGLGSFGLNNMLITSSGCAGRFGSIVVSALIPPTIRSSENYCLYFKTGKCLYCVNNCPSGALGIDFLDKKKCYSHLLNIDKQFPTLELCDACGKCAVGPCAFGAYNAGQK